MKLKLKQIDPVLKALFAIETSTDENGNRKLCRFSAKLTYNKTKAIGILSRRADALEKSRLDMVAQYAGKRNADVPEDQKPKFIEEWATQLEQEEELAGLLTLPAKDLNLYDPKDNPAGNVIPSSALAQLEPILNMDGVDAAA